ncbi:alpha-ketoacid dehydrogenase subunit beta [Alicyclobacillus fodiniaquatilis]|uniref:Alpha-ketoacid dehydrogenase subunit beta n=1 Tax=Alicyclobacillus fodiniaquatilis TaxID=1661150 RepID=A0ABW4JI48_9BACL
MTQMTMLEAIRDALDVSLGANQQLLVFGEDVGQNGGVFRATDGLQKKYGEDRVFDTPLAESAIAGLAVGLAMQEFKSVAEIQFFGFVLEAMDQILVQASRMRFRTRGRYNCPVVFRAPFGGGVKAPELHCDSFEGVFAQNPGLKVVIPSNAYDAKGLLLSAIADSDPVLFLEHLKLYRSHRMDVPTGYYTVDIGKANVVRKGTDISLFTYGAMVAVALAAAEELNDQGVSLEVVDLRTISPLDMDTVVKSIQKTNRAVVLQEAARSGGIASELIAQINEQAIYHLNGPVVRISPPDTFYPFTQFEDKWLPNVPHVVGTIQKALLV